MRGASRLVPLADDPPPGVKRTLPQRVFAAVLPGGQAARRLPGQVSPPELLKLEVAKVARHIEDSVRKSSRLPARSRTPFTRRIPNCHHNRNSRFPKSACQTHRRFGRQFGKIRPEMRSECGKAQRTTTAGDLWETRFQRHVTSIQ